MKSLRSDKVRIISRSFFAEFIFFALVFSGSANSSSLEADPQEYGFNPSTALSLGRGFLPKDITMSMRACLEPEIVPLDSGPARTSFSAVQVSSFDELARAVNFEARVEGRYLAAKGSAHFKLERSMVSQQNSVTLVVSATTDFGRWGLGPKTKLTDEAKLLLGDPLTFAKTCGTRYVAIERRASAANVILTIFNASTSLRTAMSGGASASGGSGPFSGSASASFFDEFKRASKQGRTSVQVLATGGDGFGALSSLMQNFPNQEANLEGVYKGLGDYLATFSSKNAAAYGFTVQSMEQFGFDASLIDPWDQEREDQLNAMADSYKELQGQVAIAEDWLNNGKWRRARPYLESFEDDMKNWLPYARETIRDIAARHKQCLRDGDLESCKFERSSWFFRNYLEPKKPYTLSFELTPYACPEGQDTCDWTKSDVKTSFPTIKGRKAIAVLDAVKQPNDLIHVLRNYSAGAGTFTGRIDVDGEWNAVETYQVVFSDDDGVSNVSFEMEDLGSPWMYGYSDYKDLSSGYFNMICRWMAGGTGSFEGTFLLRVRDVLGGDVMLPLMDTKWTSDGKTMKIQDLHHY